MRVFACNHGDRESCFEHGGPKVAPCHYEVQILFGPCEDGDAESYAEDIANSIPRKFHPVVSLVRAEKGWADEPPKPVSTLDNEQDN